MARMHSRDKGKSKRKLPVERKKPSWCSYDSKEIEQLVLKLAKQNKTTAQIGTSLRDSYGIPDTKAITNKKITQILKENKLRTKLPEQLIALIKRDIQLSTHREINKKDMSAKRGQQLTESKIRRLVKYYKTKKQIPQDWNYDRSKAKLLIE